MTALKILTICIALIAACSQNAVTTVREPAVAGTFYPGDSTALAQMVATHLDNMVDLPEIDGRIIAVISPHAGLVYSGQIAAFVYRLPAIQDVKRVILCGPSHRFAFEGVSVYGPDVRWRTPLGLVYCDNDLCRRLLEQDDRIRVVEQAHEREHCLEVQLPYLQTVLSDFTIAPVVMGQQTDETIKLLADALKSLETDEYTIMVASTDWQHYHPASVGWKMDSLGLECLRTLDPDRLQQYLQNRQVEACGGGPAVAVLKAAIAKGADRVKILRYGDSGDISGDKSSVVSYVAAVIYKSDEDQTDSADTATDRPVGVRESHPRFGLSDDDREKLLTVARESIRQYLATGQLPEFDVSDNLRQPGAAFVTLEKQGQLRGCIGHTIARDPLYKTVSVCAVQAAVADRRFQPVSAEELPQLHLEISVLTPLETVVSPDEIEVGRDGLMITLGQKRGLLLPQVATEYGWSSTEFLQQTCRKAGLPPDAYLSPDALVQKFQALVFGE